MTKLDRYVSSYFLSSYAICLLFFLGMFVLIDLFGNSDEIFENAGKVYEMGYSVGGLMVRFYGLMTPFIFLQVAPFVTMMAAMFAITRLRRNNELVPMIVAGRSVFRILAPLFAIALLLAAVMVAVQEYVAPPLAESRDRAEAILFDAEETRVMSGFYALGGGRFVTVHDYDLDARTIRSFDLSDMEENEPSRQGELAYWDDEQGAFFYDVEMEDGEGGVHKETLGLPPELTPELIESKERGPYDLSYTQAERLYDRTGQGRWKVLLHYHLTFPLSNLLLLMLGVPFVLRQEKRGLLLGMVVSILICAAYFAFDAVMRNLGDKDVLHPVLAAWFGVIFFGSLGVVLLDSVRT